MDSLKKMTLCQRLLCIRKAECKAEVDRKGHLATLFLNAVGRHALKAAKAGLRELFNELIKD